MHVGTSKGLLLRSAEEFVHEEKHNQILSIPT
jgi:hypothetical protein